MNKKTDKQLEAIRKSRNKELKAVLDPGFSCQGVIGNFIGIYIQSEVFAKKLQHYYRTDTKKQGKDELHITTLKAAIKHFKLSFSNEHIYVLFKGGPGKREQKTARQLRNGYLHALSPEDRQEIYKKADNYLPKLKQFLSIEIKQHNNAN